MTQLVGAICEHGTKVITISDRMVSTGDMTLSFEHPRLKAFAVTEQSVVLTAGTVHEPDLLREAREKSKGRERIIDIANVIVEIYQEIRESHMIDEVLRPRLGISEMDNWHQKQRMLHDGIVIDVDNEIQRYGLGLHLLLAGIDDKSHLIRIRDPGIYRSYDNLAYCTIGMGERHADNVFAWYKYSSEFPLNDAIYIAFEAKKRSEMAGGVGIATDVIVIDEGGIKKLNDDTVANLEKIYNEREKDRQRTGFDKRITELEIVTDELEG